MVTLFLVSFLPNTGINILIKLLLIAAVIGGAYLYWGDVADENEGDEEPEAADLPPRPPAAAPPRNGSPAPAPPDHDVEVHFESFLDVLLPLIKSTVVADSVTLLMVNYFKRQFYLRARSSDIDRAYRSSRYVDLSQGLPALVYKNRKPLLEGRLPDNSQLLPYYENPPERPRSFLAVPVFFNDLVAAVLCADSAVEEAFSQDDLNILESFSNALGIQLACSNRIFEFESENWTTRLLYDFSRELLQVADRDHLWRHLETRLKAAFPIDRFMVCRREGSGRGTVEYLTGETLGVRSGESFPDNEGVIGWVMRKNQSMAVTDFREKDNYIPRLHLNEAPADAFRALLAVPVAREGRAMVVLSMEGRRKGQFSDQHKKILETVANLISFFLEKADRIQQLDRNSLVDPGSGFGNQRAFEGDLAREIARARSTTLPFTVQLMGLIPDHRIADRDINRQVVREWLAMMQGRIPEPAHAFRMDDAHLAVIWPHQAVGDVRETVTRLHQAIRDRRGWAGGLVEQVHPRSCLAEYLRHGTTAEALWRSLATDLPTIRSGGDGILECRPAAADSGSPS